MKPVCMLLCGVVTCLAADARSPEDPTAAVPSVPYRSVFADMPKGVETDTTDWKAANTQVGRFLRGHIDILKWEAAQRPQPTVATPAAKETTRP